ncbi:MAG: hypothetical protein ACKKMS_00355 [Candidatus Nealsonbacteria bacterium]
MKKYKIKDLPKKRPPRTLFKKKSVKITRQIRRFWGLATRLEHRRIKNKKK